MTIIEVMVASALLLIVVTAVFTGVYGGLRLQATSRQRATATDWADRLMEQARNLPYEAIGLADTGAQIDAAIAAIPAGESDHPDLLLRRDTASNCLQFNIGTAASPIWERLVVADWYTPPGGASTCTTQAGGEGDNYQLRHAGVANNYTPAGTAVTYTGWVFVSWAPVQGVTPTAYYRRVTVLVRYPSATGGISRVVRASSLFSLGYVPTPSSASTSSSTSTSTSTTTTLVGTTTTLPTGCTSKPTDTQGPAGSIQLAGGNNFTNQASLTINNSVSDRPNGSGASGMATMQYSNTGATGPWLPAPAVTYDAAYSGWPVAVGDGPRQVWARFTDCMGNESTDVITDTIVLDQTSPGAPSLTGTPRNKAVDLSWTAVTDPGASASGVASYRVYRLDQGSTTPISVVTDTSTSNHQLIDGQPYTYWVRAVDRAGNEGPESNRVTVTPS
jgi:hypothetical protein